MRCDLVGPDKPELRVGSLWALAMLAGLLLWCAADRGWGQDELQEMPLEEPQALLAPVELLPVEPRAAAPAPVAGPELAGPTVKLAPELNTLMDAASARTAASVKPANFKDITPGTTTRDEVLEKLGEPSDSVEQGDKEVWRYAIGPFPQVRITVEADVVSSIVIHLAGPSPRAEVAEELGLEDLRPVVVADEQDRPLGEVYPERGLMFAYSDDVEDALQANVEHVVLETISYEPFLLRAQRTPRESFSLRLADLEIAQRLEPEDPVAFGLAAQLSLECGKPLTAQAAAQKAVELNPTSAEYRLTLADALRQLGQATEALQGTRALLDRGDLLPHQQAQAHWLVGRMLATTAPRDHREAMDETVRAIKLAASQLSSDDADVRAAMRRTLVEAELSLAEILAYGPWRQKHEVIPQWLVTAEKAANEYVEKEGGSRRILLSVYRTSLHCLLVLDGKGAPDTIAQAAIDLGRDLLAETEDADCRAAIEWELGTGLLYAAQVAYRQGSAASALALANNADTLLVSGGKRRSQAPQTAHHLAQLHFLTGSIYAIDRQDDAAAVAWYDRALPRLRAHYPDSLLDERGLVGEQLVSIGISLWETGRRNTAVSVTEEGTSLIAEAVSDGAAKKSVLSVPYQNLAAMHRQLGNAEQADRLAAKAVEADPSGADAVKRR